MGTLNSGRKIRGSTVQIPYFLLLAYRYDTGKMRNIVRKNSIISNYFHLFLLLYHKNFKKENILLTKLHKKNII